MSSLTKTLSIAAVLVIIVALVTTIVVDLARTRWDASNDRFLTVVRADAVSGVSLSTLVHVGVMGVGVRASAVATGKGPSPKEIRAAGLIPVLIVDRAGETVTAPSTFPYFWIDGAVGPHDPLVARLITTGSVLIQREFTVHTAEKALWDSGFHRFVRGHEITAAVLRQLGTSGVTARCVRAVRERGIRVLILDPAENVQVIHDVATAVEREGMHPGQPAALLPVPPRFIGIILHLGVSALVLLLLLSLFPRLPLASLLLAGGIAGVACGMNDVHLRMLDAFLLAISVPVYAASILPSVGRIGGGFKYLLTFFGITLLGGLGIAALLVHPAFIAKVYQFRGVKAAIALPPFLATGIYLWKNKIAASDIIDLRSHRPFTITLWFVALLIGGAMVWFIIMRSGNTSGLTTVVERRTRSFLETVLIARPRFKEFLLGHPLLFLFGTKAGTPVMRAGALLFGLFGQTSILNSFSHAHTPLLLSLLRTANGLALGLMIAVLVYALFLVGKRVWPQLG